MSKSKARRLRHIAALYLRSSKKQSDSSTRAQAFLIRDYARRHGLVIVKTFSDQPPSA
jgi:hypothetical protein